MIVACHNIMHGLRLGQLLATYVSLSRTLGLALLCLQETRDGHTEAVRETLAGSFAALSHPQEGLGLVYDASLVDVHEELLVPLPKLIALPRFARLYMQSRDPEQKFAAVYRVTPKSGAPFTLVNFHLDAAGGNVHRSGQLRFVVDVLRQRGLHDRLVACGDANIFAMRKHGHAYAKLLAPLTEVGAVDPETRPTHFFARTRDPKLAQRMLVRLGRFGIDMPRRYDVICANVPVASRGQIETRDSDHDLLWVRLEGAS
jgi:endonuclease/exonuclease/phosphatase family metal-dependent hydrolase